VVSIESEKESERRKNRINVVERKVVRHVRGDLLFVRRMRVISLVGSQVSPSALRGKSDSSVIISWN
jgi:hypothetical protein